MLVKKIILVLDSPWGKCKLMLFEHIKGHSSSEDKKAVKKLQSLWTHPAFLKSSAPLAQAIFKWRRKIQLMSAGLRLQRVFFLWFWGFCFFKHTAYTKTHSGCFHMFCRTNVSAWLNCWNTISIYIHNYYVYHFHMPHHNKLFQYLTMFWDTTKFPKTILNLEFDEKFQHYLYTHQKLPIEIRPSKVWSFSVYPFGHNN